MLRDAGKPLKVGEIMDGVHAAEYRSTAVNFRGLINHTLIKEKRFGQVERGVYGMKTGGKPMQGSKPMA